MWPRKLIEIFVAFMVVVINVSEGFWLTDNLNQTSVLEVRNEDLVEEARKKKKNGNYFRMLVIGAVLVKLIIFPLAVKAMAIMSTISVLLSTMSLIMSSVVGYAKVATKKPENTVKVIHVNDIWAKGDDAPSVSDGLDYSPNIPLEQIHYTIKR